MSSCWWCPLINVWCLTECPISMSLVASKKVFLPLSHSDCCCDICSVRRIYEDNQSLRHQTKVRNNKHWLFAMGGLTYDRDIAAIWCVMWCHLKLADPYVFLRNAQSSLEWKVTSLLSALKQKRLSFIIRRVTSNHTSILCNLRGWEHYIILWTLPREKLYHSAESKLLVKSTK